MKKLCRFHLFSILESPLILFVSSQMLSIRLQLPSSARVQQGDSTLVDFLDSGVKALASSASLLLLIVFNLLNSSTILLAFLSSFSLVIHW